MELKRLLLVYLSALSLLFASVVVSVVITELEAEDIAEDAKKINLAGRQRMLSQRIIYLSQSLSGLDGVQAEETRTELLAAIDELEAAVYLFEETHQMLSRDPGLDAVSSDLYFRSSPSSPSLDQRVKVYVGLAREILDDPTNAQALAGLREIERAGLLGDLDAIVTVLETQSIDRIALLRNIERGSMLLALVIILIEVAFVFVPGHRHIAKVHDRLRTSNRELERAYQSSEALRKEQSEFTYAVSHDLKSPATSIELIIGEMMTQEADRLSDDGRELLDYAMETVKRIGVQVEDILDYAMATSDMPIIETVEINDCITEALSHLRGDIAEKQAIIDVSADASLTGYRRQILMLMQNLIGNAIKYQPLGNAIRVHVTAENLPNGEGVQIVVADNGIGIDPANHGKIFKLFERLHLREEYTGTGLGLATCSRVADNHRGEIHLDSELGKGARFTVVLRTPADRSTAYNGSAQAA